MSGGEEEQREHDDGETAPDPQSIDDRGNNVPSDNDFDEEAAAYDEFVANLEQEQPYNANLEEEAGHDETMAQNEDIVDIFMRGKRLPVHPIATRERRNKPINTSNGKAEHL